MLKFVAALAGAVALALCSSAAGRAQWEWHLPPGVEPPPVPADNPMSRAKVELGRRLFYDADLSIDGTMSCATCHQQRHGFTDGNATRPGVLGDPGRRNIPGLANVAYLAPLTWADPRRTNLEGQALVPIFGLHPVEMGMDGKEGELIGRLERDRCYLQMFRRAFPETRGAIDMPAVAKALAAFERSLISFDSPFDRFARGDAAALSPAAKAGSALFRSHCASCHAGRALTDARFHAIENGAGRADQGLSEVTGDARDAGKFRTPSLLNAALTGPYLHDGSAPTLRDAIARHTIAVPALGRFTPVQEAEILAFLESLTDRTFVTNPAFSDPVTACGKRL